MEILFLSRLPSSSFASRGALYVSLSVGAAKLRGRGGIGRRAGLRIRWATMQVRPLSPAPKNTAEKDTFSAVFFYPSRRLGISSPHEVWWISSALWAVYHHASACIFLRLDDIQNFVLMICNSFGIDDIHAFGVIRIRECEKLLNCYAKYDII